MKRFFLIFIILILAVTVGEMQSQSITWQKEYQYVAKTEGEVICQTFDSGFVASGLYIHGGYYVIRTDKYGDTIWTKLFYDRNPYKVIQIRDSSFIFVGQASGVNGVFSDGFIQKVSPSGIQIWKKKFGTALENAITDIIELENKDFLCYGGTVFNFSPLMSKTFLLKVNQSADSIFQIYYDSSIGGAGSFSFFNEKRILMNALRPFITDMNGNVIRYSEITNLGKGLVDHKDNSLIFVKDIIDSNDYRVIHVTKTDSNFNVLEERNIKILLRVLKTFDFILGNNCFTICGIANTDIENRIGGFIMEIDSKLKVLSYKEYINDLRVSSFSSIRLCFDKGYATVGSITPIIFGYNNILITKTDSSGNSVLLGIKHTSSEIQNSFNLKQNYPNPFNSQSKIEFDLIKSGNVILKISDILGKEIEILFNGYLEKGNHSFDFKPKSNLSSGVYFYTIEFKTPSGKIIKSKKLILNK